MLRIKPVSVIAMLLLCFSLLIAEEGRTGEVIIGPQFDVAVGPNGQIAPFIAYDAYSNRFLVVWDEHLPRPSTDIDIYGQLVNPNGTLYGSRIAVSRIRDSQQGTVKTAFDSTNRRFLVIFGDNRSGLREVYGQLLNSDGNLYGGNFRISPPSSTSTQTAPVNITFDPILNRFFALIVQTSTSGKSDLYGQFVNGDGSLSGPFFPITDFPEASPVLSSSMGYDSNNGRFFIVYGRGGVNIVGATLLNADGTLYGRDFTISSALGGVDSFPIPFDPVNNRFLVLWNRSDNACHGQLVNANGTFYGNELIINFNQAFDAGTGIGIFDTAGNKFLVAAFTSLSAIAGQLLNPDGSLDGQNFNIVPDTNRTILRSFFAFGAGQTGSIIVWPDIPSGLDYDLFGKFVRMAQRPPVLDPIGNRAVDEGVLLEFTISATDLDGDPLTYSASNLPSGATFNPTTGIFSWTPGFNQAGTYTNVHFEVTDGSLTDSEDITITANNVNRPPVLNAIGNKSVNVGDLLEFTIQATDPDNDPIEYYMRLAGDVNNDNHLTPIDALIIINALNRYGGIIFPGEPGWNPDMDLNNDGYITNADVLIIINMLNAGITQLPIGATINPQTGQFSWTPNFNQAGTYNNVRFVATDGSLTDSEDITITVNNVNRSPVLSGIGNRTVNEGALLQFTISATDLDGDPLTYSAGNLPPGATFNPTTGIFSWTPNFNQAGTYKNVHFEVTDGLLTDSEDITITVNNVNSPPIFDPVPTTMHTCRLKLFRLHIKARDPEGGKVTYRVVNKPKHATFYQCLGRGYFFWFPWINQAGEFRVSFIARDSAGKESSITVTIIVCNSPPSLWPIGDKTVRAHRCLTFRLRANDPDRIDRCGWLRFHADNLPSGAHLNPYSGHFFWFPRSNQRGTYTIRFYVKDPPGLIDEETITITVI